MKYGDTATKRQCKKLLLKYKQAAQESARQILNKKTGWLYTDGKAAKIYMDNRNAGRDHSFDTIVDSQSDQQQGRQHNVPVISTTINKKFY
jgi:hypothetical protein